MECVRAMSAGVWSGATSAAIGRSESVRVRGGVGVGVKVVGSVRVGRGLALRRSGVVTQASASGADEPLDKAARGVGRDLDEASEGLREKASGEVDEGKQSLGGTVDDLKTRAGETRSHAEDTASKELEKLKDITNQLLEQAELARQKIAATAQETALKQKDNLEYVAENGPEPVKEVAESALSAHYSETGKTGAKIHDFCLGIPYGIYLAAGGLLWFIVSGANSAIRFGVLLGSALLYLSVTSLKKWKKGESSMAYIQGQAAITAFIFFRHYKRYSANKVFFPTGLTGLISGAMLAFYIYVLVSGGNPPKKPKTQAE